MITAISAGRAASPELRDRLALNDAAVRDLVRAPREGITELVALSTCHRTELYVAGDHSGGDIVHRAVALLPDVRPTDHSQLQVMHGADAVRHIYRVACGLDSLVVGEPQILSQVRRAYAIASEEGATGPTLSMILSRAIRLGRAVRRSSDLGARSIGALTATMIAERLGDLSRREGAVIGSGQAASDAATALRTAGARLAVIGRSRAAVDRLAHRVDGISHALDELPVVLERSDFAVVAVGGGSLLTQDVVGDRERPLLLVDLSVPRAVTLEPTQVIDIRSIEDLPATEAGLTGAIAAAEDAVERAVDEWSRWVAARPSRDVERLRAHAEAITNAEVARTLARMDVSPEERDRVTAMAQRLVNRLMHGPTVAMRDGDEALRAAVRHAFGLDAEA